MRHDPITLLEHVVRRTERCRIVGLPWIVAEEPEQNPGGTQEHQAQLLDGSIRSGRRQFRRAVGSIQRIGQRHRLLMPGHPDGASLSAFPLSLFWEAPPGACGRCESWPIFTQFARAGSAAAANRSATGPLQCKKAA